MGGESVPYANHSVVVIRRHPGNVEKAVGWLVVDPPTALCGDGQKAAALRKVLVSGFRRRRADQCGQGPVADRRLPLFVDLRAESDRGQPLGAMELASRPALIDLPPVFSQRRLMEHVTHLASEPLQGRGVGSPGLQLAAEYIAEQFAAAEARTRRRRRFLFSEIHHGEGPRQRLLWSSPTLSGFWKEPTMPGRTRWWWSAPTTTIWVWVGPTRTRATRAGFIPAPMTTPAG